MCVLTLSTMKKLDKIKLSQNFLNPEELKSLKGGENVNKNWYVSCECTYYNGQQTVNDNTTISCKCTCTY
jgi:natural product precursor